MSLVAYLRPDIVALVLTLKTTGVRQRHDWCLPPARMVAGTGTSAGGRAHSGHDGHIYKRDDRLMCKCLPVSNDILPGSVFRPDTVLMDE